MGKVKNILKHILPPPVNAFNREITSLQQLIIEQNKAQMTKIVDLEVKMGGGNV